MKYSVVNTYSVDEKIIDEWIFASLKSNTNQDDVSVNYITNKSFLEEVRQTIKKYDTFEEDWDSYGAQRISLDAITNSLDFLDLLELKQQDIFHVSPSPLGGVTIELSSGEKNIEIDFLPRGKTEVAYYVGDELVKEDVRVSFNSLQSWLNA